jgi:hypothetical protein
MGVAGASLVLAVFSADNFVLPPASWTGNTTDQYALEVVGPPVASQTLTLPQPMGDLNLNTVTLGGTTWSSGSVFTDASQGPVTINQYGGLPLTGCLPAAQNGGTVKSVQYTVELNFTGPGFSTSSAPAFGAAFVASIGTLPPGNYYAGVFSEATCTNPVYTSLGTVTAGGPAIFPLINGFPTAQTVFSNSSYAIEVFQE